jgi:GNAT superfamily N-acetyltransferase
MSSYHIRTATRSEVDQAVSWAAQEGWNPGLQDAECFWQADPQGFWVGELDGEAIASISAVRYGSSFGFIGFYIVKPEYRGQGYGIQLWNAALHVLEGRTVGLDGVVAQQANYKRSGFTLAHHNMRFRGSGGGETSSNPQIMPLSEQFFDQVALYDRRYFPTERSAFLQSWLQQPGHTALGFWANDMLQGYGVVRPCQVGYKIGPLFAEDRAIADQLFRALKAQVPVGEPFFLDIPEPNTEGWAIAAQYQMTAEFETARMYLGQAPELSLNHIFGVTTFELG